MASDTACCFLVPLQPKGGSFTGDEKDFLRFKLGDHSVIPAFEEAVSSMKVGSKAGTGFCCPASAAIWFSSLLVAVAMVAIFACGVCAVLASSAPSSQHVHCSGCNVHWKLYNAIVCQCLLTTGHTA